MTTPIPVGPEQLKRSIDSLQRLYTFVISLAVTESLRQFLAPAVPNDLWFAYWRSWIMLLFTIVPFYHGANAHLDQTYLFGFQGARREKRYALLVDFSVLFAEAILFFALALSLNDSERFLRIYQLILGVDVLWAVFVYFSGDHGSSDHGHAIRWGLLNFIAIVLVAFVHDTQVLAEAVKPDWVLGIALARTIADYYLCWDFYLARYQMLKSV